MDTHRPGRVGEHPVHYRHQLDYLVLTMVREDTNNHEVGLFYYDSTGFNRIANTGWTDDGSSYKNAYVFCPDPSSSDLIYVNVLTTDKSFGDTEWSYVDSQMYTYTVGTVGDDWGDSANPGWTELTSPNIRYIDSVTIDAPTTVFSAIYNAELNTDNSILLADDGTEIPAAVIDRPVTGITWLPTIGAYIAGATSINASSIYPVFASDNIAGDNWVEIGGSSEYRLQSFVDVTGTEAGGAPYGVGGRTDRILAGSRSFESDSGVGYVEILLPDVWADPTEWTISNSDLDFAYSNNYTVSDLREASITAFSLLSGPVDTDQYVYASTLGDGLWRINADDYPSSDGQAPRWAIE